MNQLQGASVVAWVAVAITLLLVLAQAAPKYAGWLLVMLVLGMIYQARKRNLI